MNFMEFLENHMAHKNEKKYIFAVIFDSEQPR